MSGEIVKVSLDDASEKLRDAIKLAFVEVIPTEQWHAMIKAELEKFTRERVVPRSWHGGHDERKPSILAEICETEFRKFATALVTSELQKPEYAGDATLVSDAVGQWLTANSATLVQQTVAVLLGGAAQNLVSSVRGMWIQPERM